ncbi:hypothetical protein [Actinotalea sp.]|uniref:hypothetical protein n=1 Tax=Actinotalea sp. TaxID=1872145 RepID=UPI00356AF77D
MTSTTLDGAAAPVPTGAAIAFLPAGQQHPRAGAVAVGLLREELARPIADPDLVARLVAADPATAVRVLGRANSGTRPGERLDTVAQAMEVVDRWALAGLVDELVRDAVPAVPQLWRVLARALACERLSGDRRGYSVGLLSALGDLHGLPLDELLDLAGVSGTVRLAVTARRGRLGAALGALLGYLADDAAATERHGFAPHAVYEAYVEAATTAMTMQTAVGPGGATRTTAGRTAAPSAVVPQQRAHGTGARPTPDAQEH